MPKDRGDACGQTTPEQDRRIAREALDVGDLSHAAHHIAGLLAVDPLADEHRALLDELLERAPDPLDLAPAREQMYFGEGALRAAALAREGRTGEAVALLLQILAVKPDVPFVPWIEEWLQPPGAPHHVDPEALAHPLQRISESARSLPRERAQALIARLSMSITQVEHAHPRASILSFVHSVVVRRAGLLDQAVEIAQRAKERCPSYHVCVALAGAHRERGQAAEAISAFRDALAFSPDDVSVRLDIGDLSLDLGRRDDALAAYREALAREPAQPWALASARALQWEAGDAAAGRELRRLAESGNERAQRLLGYDPAAYLEYLPEPGEATIQAARRLLEQEGVGAQIAGRGVRMALSCLEAPSAHASAARTVQELASAAWVVDVERVPEPDPRVPRKPVRWLLWKYEGTDPKPALSAPDPNVHAAIASIAEQAFDRETWLVRARAIALEIGPEAIEGALATMVHPGPTPSGRTAWGWMFALQVAAAFVIAWIDAGWKGSVRRDALRALVYGPTDWSTTAGIVALTELALAEPEIASEARMLLLELRDARPSFGYWCVEEPLRSALERLSH